jgi:hypothetical protein
MLTSMSSIDAVTQTDVMMPDGVDVPPYSPRLDDQPLTAPATLNQTVNIGAVLRRTSLETSSAATDAPVHFFTSSNENSIIKAKPCGAGNLDFEHLKLELDKLTGQSKEKPVSRPPEPSDGSATVSPSPSMHLLHSHSAVCLSGLSSAQGLQQPVANQQVSQGVQTSAATKQLSGFQCEPGHVKLPSAEAMQVSQPLTCAGGLLVGPPKPGNVQYPLPQQHNSQHSLNGLPVQPVALQHPVAAHLPLQASQQVGTVQQPTPVAHAVGQLPQMNLPQAAVLAQQQYALAQQIQNQSNAQHQLPGHQQHQSVQQPPVPGQPSLPASGQLQQQDQHILLQTALASQLLADQQSLASQKLQQSTLVPLQLQGHQPLPIQQLQSVIPPHLQLKQQLQPLVEQQTLVTNHSQHREAAATSQHSLVQHQNGPIQQAAINAQQLPYQPTAQQQSVNVQQMQQLAQQPPVVVQQVLPQPSYPEQQSTSALQQPQLVHQPQPVPTQQPLPLKVQHPQQPVHVQERPDVGQLRQQQSEISQQSTQKLPTASQPPQPLVAQQHLQQVQQLAPTVGAQQSHDVQHTQLQSNLMQQLLQNTQQLDVVQLQYLGQQAIPAQQQQISQQQKQFLQQQISQQQTVSAHLPVTSQQDMDVARQIDVPVQHSVSQSLLGQQQPVVTQQQCVGTQPYDVPHQSVVTPQYPVAAPQIIQQQQAVAPQQSFLPNFPVIAPNQQQIQQCLLPQLLMQATGYPQTIWPHASQNLPNMAALAYAAQSTQFPNVMNCAQFPLQQSLIESGIAFDMILRQLPLTGVFSPAFTPPGVQMPFSPMMGFVPSADLTAAAVASPTTPLSGLLPGTGAVPCNISAFPANVHLAYLQLAQILAQPNPLVTPQLLQTMFHQALLQQPLRNGMSGSSVSVTGLAVDAASEPPEHFRKGSLNVDDTCSSASLPEPPTNNLLGSVLAPAVDTSCAVNNTPAGHTVAAESLGEHINNIQRKNSANGFEKVSATPGSFGLVLSEDNLTSDNVTIPAAVQSNVNNASDQTTLETALRERLGMHPKTDSLFNSCPSLAALEIALRERLGPGPKADPVQSARIAGPSSSVNGSSAVTQPTNQESSVCAAVSSVGMGKQVISESNILSASLPAVVGKLVFSSTQPVAISSASVNSTTAAGVGTAKRRFSVVPVTDMTACSVPCTYQPSSASSEPVSANNSVSTVNPCISELHGTDTSSSGVLTATVNGSVSTKSAQPVAVASCNSTVRVSNSNWRSVPESYQSSVSSVSQQHVTDATIAATVTQLAQRHMDQRVSVPTSEVFQVTDSASLYVSVLVTFGSRYIIVCVALVNIALDMNRSRAY